MYQIVSRDGRVTQFEISKISKAISKAFIGMMAQDFHPEVLESLMDEMDDLPLLERTKEVIAKKKLRKMDSFIRLIWKAKAAGTSQQLRQLWMNRNKGVNRSNTTAVTDMMLMTMPVPPSAPTAKCSLWQRGF